MLAYVARVLRLSFVVVHRLTGLVCSDSVGLVTIEADVPLQMAVEV